MPTFKGICLVTDDVRRLARFYAEILCTGFEGDASHAVVDVPGASLSIASTVVMESMSPGSTAGAGRGALTIEFIVEDVDADFVRIQALGVKVIKPPASYPWGTRSAWFRDPDGNVVNLVCPAQPQDV